MPKVVRDGFASGIIATILSSMFLVIAGVFANDHVLNAEQELKIGQAIKAGIENKKDLKDISKKTNNIEKKVTKMEAQLQFIFDEVRANNERNRAN